MRVKKNIMGSASSGTRYPRRILAQFIFTCNVRKQLYPSRKDIAKTIHCIPLEISIITT